MGQVGLLILRLTVGGLLAGHGAQKLFGWFGGYGLEGTRGWLKSLGMRPGWLWARAAGAGEFGGGILTALGLMHPIGPIMMLGPMTIAVGKVHRGKPIWATEGGAELPLTNLAIGLALALIGPGRFSMDRALGIRIPTALLVLTAAAVAATTTTALTSQETADPRSRQAETAGAELQAGVGAASSSPL